MKNPVAEARPMTVGVFLLTLLWAIFQWRDPTPPPALDQILVAAFGIWFANEAVGKKNKGSKRSVKVDNDGNVSISEILDEDEDEDEADDDADSKKNEGSG